MANDKLDQDLVQPFQREGAWLIPFPFLFKVAHEFKAEFDRLTSELRAEEASLRQKHESEDPSLIDGLVDWETEGIRHALAKAEVAAILFACMAIESFVNDYGTRRLGEKYFKRNLERLRIAEKISVLLLICGLARMEPGDPLLARIERVFQERNSIVHPKTKEIKESFQLGNRGTEVDEAFETLRKFLQRMKELDSDLSFTLSTAEKMAGVTSVQSLEAGPPGDLEHGSAS